MTVKLARAIGQLGRVRDADPGLASQLLFPVVNTSVALGLQAVPRGGGRAWSSKVHTEFQISAQPSAPQWGPPDDAPSNIPSLSGELLQLSTFYYEMFKMHRKVERG